MQTSFRSRPRRFDYNLVVIGAGSAGLVTAYLAAATKARVALIEQDAMGGECLNTGCVPSKALIRSAKLAGDARNASRFGLSGTLDTDFPAVLNRIRRVIQRIAPHDSAERYTSLGVEVIKGRARLRDPWTVEVGDRQLIARKIVIATGAEPVLPPVTGLGQVNPLTSETIWSMSELPRVLLVVGGGATGCELAQSFARLGSRTILLEAASRLLEREDEDVGDEMRKLLIADGVEVMTGVAIERFDAAAGQYVVHLRGRAPIPFDRVLVAVGRQPRTRGFGLEELGLLENGRLVVNDHMQTRLPHIYAAGDVIGALQFSHAAAQYAWLASANAMFGILKRWKFDARFFPMTIYTDPEVARVGLSEREAGASKTPYETTRFELGELDRAIADEAGSGFIKVLTAPGKDRILGVTIVGAHAGDMLSEFTLAMKNKLGLKAILRTIHPYPGWTDANKAVAAEWQRARIPGWALRLSERWHAWQRR